MIIKKKKIIKRKKIYQIWGTLAHFKVERDIMSFYMDITVGRYKFRLDQNNCCYQLISYSRVWIKIIILMVLICHFRMHAYWSFWQLLAKSINESLKPTHWPRRPTKVQVHAIKPRSKLCSMMKSMRAIPEIKDSQSQSTPGSPFAISRLIRYTSFQ